MGDEHIEGGLRKFLDTRKGGSEKIRGTPKICRQTDRQTDMYLFGVLYKESTLITIPNK